MTPNHSSEPKLARTGAAKKPSWKSAFRYERVFETTALSCGKIGPTQSTCRHNRKTS